MINDEANYTLVRHDLNKMLKLLAAKMYNFGVRDEVVLLQKVPKEDRSEEPQFGELKISRRISQKQAKGQKLSNLDEEKFRDKIYTSTELQKLWEQLFLHHSGSGHHAELIEKKRVSEMNSHGPTKSKTVMFNLGNEKYEGGNEEKVDNSLNRTQTNSELEESEISSDDKSVNLSQQMPNFHTKNQPHMGQQVKSALAKRGLQSPAGMNKVIDFLAVTQTASLGGKVFTPSNDPEEYALERYDQVQYFISAMVERNREALEESKIFLDRNKKNNKSIIRTLIEKNSTKEQKKIYSVIKLIKKRVESKQEKQHEVDRLEIFLDLKLRGGRQEERLQLWNLLSDGQKSDMLMHQMVEHEAQMMALMLEAEIGVQKILQKSGQIWSDNLQFDEMLEQALNQMLFKKYFNLARLMASTNAKAYSKDRLEEASQRDIQIIKYGKYLQKLAVDAHQLNVTFLRKIDKMTKYNDKFKNNLRRIAAGSLESAEPAMRKKIQRRYKPEQIQIARQYVQLEDTNSKMKFTELANNIQTRHGRIDFFEENDITRLFAEWQQEGSSTDKFIEKFQEMRKSKQKLRLVENNLKKKYLLYNNVGKSQTQKLKTLQLIHQEI